MMTDKMKLDKSTPYLINSYQKQHIYYFNL